MKTRRALLLLTLAGLVPEIGCSNGSGSSAGNPEPVTALAPALGGADGTDSADRECHVVLRSMARPTAQGGYATDCTSGACYFTWQGFVDVSDEAIAAGVEPGLLFQSGSDPTWWEVAPAEELADAPAAGFRRFRFVIDRHVPGPGMSMTALMNTRIQLIPLLHHPGGGRVFDHNRVASELDAYRLTKDNAWAIADDPAVCAGGPKPEATVQFLGDFTQAQHGALVAGGKVSLEYALSRLPACRASYTYAPTWGMEVQGRFLPGGETFTAPVVQFETNEYGQVHDVPSPLAAVRDIPAGAQSLEVWFRNWSGMSSPCETWDSAFGANYRFAIHAQKTASVGWAGDWGSSLDRSCAYQSGVEDPLAVDSYRMERACLQVFADVYVPGVTDAAERHPEWLLAQVEWSKDGGAARHDWLGYVDRVGNNYRFRWDLPRSELSAEEWRTLRYTFRFSTDGVTWTVIGNDAGVARTVARRFEHTGWAAY